MMVESMFALIKNGKLYVRKTLMEDGMFIKLMLHAGCLATIIMVSIYNYNVCFANSFKPARDPTGASVERLCLDSTDLKYIDISECSGTENTFEECGINRRDFDDCKNCKDGKRHPGVVCLPGNILLTRV